MKAIHASVLAVAAALGAQSVTVTIPAGPVPPMVHCSDEMLSLYTGVHLQVVVERQALPPGAPTLSIRSLALGVLGSSQPAASAELTVRLGHTDRTSLTLTRSFSRNASEPLTTVASGLLPLPAVPAGPEVAFVPIAFDAPFTYDPHAGNLLIDIAVPTGAPHALRLIDRPLATVQQFGDVPQRVLGGVLTPNALLTTFGLEPATGNLAVQHSIPREAGQAVAFLVGSSNQQHGGVSLPWSLAWLGAPGMSIAVAPEIVLSATTVWDLDQCATLHVRDGIRTEVPVDPSLAGAVYFTQAVVVGGQSGQNAADLATTDGHHVTLSSMERGPAQMMHGLGTDDFGYLPGHARLATSIRAPVLRLVVSSD
jgi:hypothetical protein